MTATVLLEARGLAIRFGGVVAADGVDLDVLEGEKLAIIGPNGAGKTTFLNIATGYLKPQAGTVRFLGKEITAHRPRDITRFGIARAFQIPQLFLDHTVIENLLIAAAGHSGRTTLMRSLHDLPERSDMENLLDLVSIRDVADRKAGELPEGKRKLVDIAVALALKPRLLLMDEPTSGEPPRKNSRSWIFWWRRWKSSALPRCSSNTTWTWSPAMPIGSRCGAPARSR